MSVLLDEGYQGLASNTATDILFDGRYIWVGTGAGLSRYDADVQTWFSYNKGNGLNQNGISALTYADSTLWAALSYSVPRDNLLYPFGADFNTTKTSGEDWDTLKAGQASGYGRVCYDIANTEGEVWAACWYGGLIRSQDSGKTWVSVFPNWLSQQDWELGYFERFDNKFFSVLADTSPTESYLDKNFITKIDGKAIQDTLLLWVGTKNGLHFSFDTSGIWTNVFDTSTGFHKNSISTVSMGDSSVWAGICYEADGKLIGAGIQRSKDYGAHWTYHTPAQASSDSEMVLDIASVGDSLVWAACWHGGLIGSQDSGSTWDSIFVDLLARYNFEHHIEDPRNNTYAVAVDTISDTLILWAGTEAGIFKFIYTSSDSFDTAINYNYSGSSISGDSVFSLAIQKYGDKKMIWAGTGPKGSIGAFGISKSDDNGQTWQIPSSLTGTEVRDFAFSDSVVWIATNVGLKRSLDWGSSWDSIEIADSSARYSYFRASAHKLKSYDLNSILVWGDTIWVGGRDGLARSTDPDRTWKIFNFFISYDQAIWAGSAAGIFKFIYNQSDTADTALQYTTSQNLTGNFVVALAIQKYLDKKIIWSATNPTYAGTGANGISKSEDEGKTWVRCLEGTRVWNFAFCDSVVWAATDVGLQRSLDFGASWEVFNHMKDLNDTLTENRIFSTVFYSVCAVKDSSSGEWTIWAGNLDGVVRSVDIEAGRWNVFRSFVPIGMTGSRTAYAYPSPFSPVVSSGARVRIHHRPLENSFVTVKIYDFAMSLVTTLVDGEFRSGGTDFDEPWDGRNDRGDLVANGVYFFKVETSKAQREWGKLVILK